MFIDWASDSSFPALFAVLNEDRAAHPGFLLFFARYLVLLLLVLLLLLLLLLLLVLPMLPTFLLLLLLLGHLRCCY